MGWGAFCKSGRSPADRCFQTLPLGMDGAGGIREIVAWWRSGVTVRSLAKASLLGDAVNAFLVPLSGLDRVAHLFGDYPADEPEYTVGLPTGGLHDLGQHTPTRNQPRAVSHVSGKEARLGALSLCLLTLVSGNGVSRPLVRRWRLLAHVTSVTAFTGRMGATFAWFPQPDLGTTHLS